MGSYVFGYCSKLKTLRIPESMTEISSGMLLESSVTTLVIPESITRIGYGLDYLSWPRFTAVCYEGIPVQWGEIDICTSVWNAYIKNAPRYYYSETEPLTEGNWYHIVDGVPTVWNPVYHQHTESVLPAVEAICTAHGLTEGKCCSVCGDILVRQEKTMKALHQYSNGICTYCGEAYLPATADKYLKFTLLSDGTYSVAVDSTDGTLTHYVIPGSYNGKLVTQIAEYGFQQCGLQSIVIPDTITTIGAYAFSMCNKIKSITIPASVTTLGREAFSNMNSLETLIFDENCSILSASRAIFGCKNLKTIKLPNSMNTIFYEMFMNLSALTFIDIPDGVKAISAYAFEYDYALESVVIPATVMCIDEGAFRYTNLKRVYYGGTEEQWTAITYGRHSCENVQEAERYYYSETEPETDGKYWHYVAGIPTVWGEECEHTLVDDPAVKATCTANGLTAGQHCADCNGVLVAQTKIPAKGHDFVNGTCSHCGVASEEYFVFYRNGNDGYLIKAKDVTNIPSVLVLPKYYKGLPVKGIYSSGFADCKTLTQVIEPGAFSNSYLKNIYFRGYENYWNNIKYIHTLYNGSALTSSATVYFYSKTEPTAQGDYWYYSDNSRKIWPSNYSSGLKFTAIYENSKVVGYSVGKGTCTDVNIVIPSKHNGLSVTEIGSGSSGFYNLKKLVSVFIPSTVKTIGAQAFEGCISLTDVNFGDNSQLTTMGSSMFKNCTSLESIQLPYSLTSLGSSSFYGCTKLKNITLPNKLTGISAYTFNGCTSLTYAVLGTNTTEINTKAFYGCTALESIVIPTKMKSIYANAFENCSALKNVFYCAYSSSWSSVYIYATGNTTIKEATLYVSGDWKYVDGVPTVK